MKDPLRQPPEERDIDEGVLKVRGMHLGWTLIHMARKYHMLQDEIEAMLARNFEDIRTFTLDQLRVRDENSGKEHDADA
jgi:hypothetical protein